MSTQEEDRKWDPTSPNPKGSFYLSERAECVFYPRKKCEVLGARCQYGNFGGKETSLNAAE